MQKNYFKLMARVFVYCALGCFGNAMALDTASLPINCQVGEVPKVVHKLENYDIIATNDANIPTADAFSGANLTYSLSAHPVNAKNKIKIDAKTGNIQVKAEYKDDFDVKVIAKNPCGSVSVIFNIVIDEEE